MTTTTPLLRIATTDYEGPEVEFPEAAHYPEFIAAAAAELLREHGIVAEVEASGGALESKVFAYGALADDAHADLVENIARLVKVEWWDQFCDYGYKAFTKSGTTP